mmetsp:Transcript_9933/g.13827  ORF Transcript_9933/g.13827 Transcript_9933/m.13827 type:complete len:125 (-) Transcript_9933:51-425(-)|eukprot:CAMPEP_0184479116 /NCGR_PEP_ID=MMETSP0113_2-20130426/963_1 /TAXON_ID=91329 /ORGANISM="Norrisiella sphaerica, Strain BC52" /LENGTH=124 /DNA_ID=CAMNT_0026857125 /DNA_START=21 /DNA_END=395 /DNA_ORIENTATION=+
MGKIKAHELREKKTSDLLQQLDNFRTELSQLRVSKVSGQGGPSKLSKIKVIRKSIARVLTVYNEKRRNALKKASLKSKFIPLDLRKKQTRAIRRSLSKHWANKKTVKQQKKESYYPLRKYALKA